MDKRSGSQPSESSGYVWVLSSGAEVAKKFEISLVLMSPICHLSKRNSLRIETKVGASLQRMDTSPLVTTEGWSS